ncbi:histamine H2 receptor-like [Paramuricea clavata]|uniref:Histamine H2 receptor-like n=1 Tax=Paramuricea clavata TaxID=317549 RepID=A0A7D9HIE4_PARCT|nr:histamine H2 receptor-like [Paramuricea clavata]
MVMENTFEKRCRIIDPPTELSFTTASMAIVFILTNIPGNLLVILAVVLDPNKNLRTPFNWLVVNLAAADLIVGVIVQPLKVHFHIKEGLEKNHVPEEINLINMVYFISCTASVLSLTSLAIERYLAVTKPYTYRNKVTNKRIVLTIVIIWLISLSLPNIYLNVGFFTYVFIFSNTFMAVGVIIICMTYTRMMQKVSKARSLNGRYGAALSTSGEASNKPLQPQSFSAVITKVNTPNAAAQNTQLVETIALSTSAEAKSLPSQDHDQFPTTNTNISSSNVTTICSNTRQLFEEKITKMFLIVLIALLCSYGPSTVMIYFVNFCEDCSCSTLHCLEDVSVLLILMNSSINFFCYALRCRRFRNAFAKLLRINRR